MAQPNKGPRDLLAVRPTRAVANRVREEATARGISYSQYAAEVLAAHFGLPATNPPADKGQEELPLQNTA